MSEPRPCGPLEAVARAERWVDSDVIYWLGCGDYRPQFFDGKLLDKPWTPAPDGQPASDCRFATLYCYKLPAHRPGFNRGAWATVSDDINYNSAIEDSEHARELYVPVTGAPELGDIVCYPTIRIRGADGQLHTFIGHGAIVVGVSRAAAFDPAAPRFSLLDVIHCHGPSGSSPAITRANGAIWDHHSEVWPKIEHRSRLLRLVP